MLRTEAVRPELAKMTNALSHRGPDAEGFYHDDNVSLGHRRLSIIDLSDAANQPFIDPTGRYVLVFNGEMYNYRDVRAELSSYSFRTQSDTEVLLAAFIKWGPACINKFKGMFAFALWDKEEERLYVCRDRMGVKPLYYYHTPDHFLFASEIRGILASGLVQRKLDRLALADYFTFQSFGSPGSPIDEIRQLEAGTYMVVSKKGSEIKQYWELGKAGANIDVNDVELVKKEIKRLLSQAVQQRLVSDVPIGAFLSGGIDSSAVVALMSEVSDKPPVTFNIAFSEKEFDERKYADIVARKYQTEHHQVQLSQNDFLENIVNALNAIDTPSADGVNTYVVSKAIRNAGITVALSGIGGDELFAGYPFFMQYQKMHRYSVLFKSTGFLRRPLASLVANASNRRQRIAAILRASELNISSLYPQFRTILAPDLINELTQLNWNGHTKLEKKLAEQEEKMSGLPLLSQVSVAEYNGYTQQTLLKDTDQMSMAHSLEVREPFFDHELVELVLRIPDHIKTPVYPKSLLVESLKPMLPDEIVFRKKQGFLFPWTIWMRKELRSFCEERILRMAQRDFVNGPELTRYWNRFLSGDNTVNWTDLWVFVVLENWMDKNSIS